MYGGSRLEMAGRRPVGWAALVCAGRRWLARKWGRAAFTLCIAQE